MSRSKSVPDDILLDRLMEAIQVHGPAELSFAKASAYAGLSASTLVQRFGDRNGMIQAVLLRSWDALDAATAEADAAAGEGPGGVIDLLLRLTHEDASADYDTTDGLLLLREDIRDPVLRARGAAWGDYLVAAVSRRLGGMGEGAEVVSLWQGAVFWWAFRRNGRLTDTVRAALEDRLLGRA